MLSFFLLLLSAFFHAEPSSLKMSVLWKYHVLIAKFSLEPETQDKPAIGIMATCLRRLKVFYGVGGVVIAGSVLNPVAG